MSGPAASTQDEVLARCARANYERLIEPLRAKARELGYALAVHGSLQRDIDLLAVAWVEDAGKPDELAEALRTVAEEITGFAAWDPADPARKPHGRLAWAILLGGGSYIDLSVIGPTDHSQSAPSVAAAPAVS